MSNKDFQPKDMPVAKILDDLVGIIQETLWMARIYAEKSVDPNKNLNKIDSAINKLTSLGIETVDDQRWIIPPVFYATDGVHRE